MKRTVLNVSTAFVLLSSSSFSIPVIDAAQVSESVLTLARWVDQGVTWEREIRQWKKKMSALKDFRLDASILTKFTELNTLLNRYGLDMGDLDLNNPKSGIGVYAKQLFESYTLFDDCAYAHLTGDQKRICKNKMVRNVQEIATITKFSDNLTDLLGKLNRLNSELAHAKDIKSSQDIAAGIQATVTSMEAMKIKYEMMVIQNEATRKMEERQTEQIQKAKRKNSSAFIHQQF